MLDRAALKTYVSLMEKELDAAKACCRVSECMQTLLTLQAALATLNANERALYPVHQPSTLVALTLGKPAMPMHGIPEASRGSPTNRLTSSSASPTVPGMHSYFENGRTYSTCFVLFLQKVSLDCTHAKPPPQAAVPPGCP